MLTFQGDGFCYPQHEKFPSSVKMKSGEEKSVRDQFTGLTHRLDSHQMTEASALQHRTRTLSASFRIK